MVRWATALLLSCLVSGAAAAADTKIGDVSLNLPPPPGYCEMDVVQASDAHLISNIHAMLGKTGNRLLVLSADCGELREWRAGKRPTLDHMAQYQTVVGFENSPLPDTPDKMILNFCGQLHAADAESSTGPAQDVQKRAERAFESLRVNEIRLLGVVGADPLVCYAALLQKFNAESGGEKTQATVFATTVLKGKVVLYYLLAPYVRGETITQMLAKQRTSIGRLQRANRN
jgi:hypothetical protein